MDLKNALITGASGGIGLELSKQFAQGGYGLVLVARSAEKLEQLASDLRDQYGVNVTVITKDLAKPAAPDELYQELRAKGIQIDVLVNNAGFATYGKFTEIALQTELQEMQLNMVTLTHLSKLFTKDMVARGSGKVLNVASTAAFQPGPLMAVYSATKAYVLSFSDALANELKGTGVTVTALCPGPTESGFQARADMEDSKFIQNTSLMSATEVAKAGYEALLAGKAVVVPGVMNQLGTFVPRLLPREMVTRIVRRVQAR